MPNKDPIKIIIFGANSYLGHNIVKNIAILFPSTNISFKFSERNPTRLIGPETFYFDPCLEQTYDNIPKNWDYIFYLLSPSVSECDLNPDLARIVCTTAPVKILTISPPSNPNSKFIYFSTIHVLGTPIPSDPTHTASTNLNPYAFAHLEGEKKLQTSPFPEKNIFILRIGNVFGGQFPNPHRGKNLIGNLLIKMHLRKNLEPHISSNGLQYRSFVPMIFFLECLAHILTQNNLLSYIVWPKTFQILEFWELLNQVMSGSPKKLITGEIKDLQEEPFNLYPATQPKLSFNEYLEIELGNFQ